MSDPAAVLTSGDRSLLWVLSGLTLFCFVLAVIVPLRAVRRRRDNRLRRRRFSGLLTVALFLLLILTLQRYAVGYYVSRVLPDEADGLNAAERAADSLLHGLQTFSMDEDYTLWLANGKSMMTALCGGNGWAGTVYGLVFSLLHVAAPVIGGAFILNILMSFLPKLRLALIEIFCRRRQKYYFSELNARSLTLAESLCSRSPARSGKTRKNRRPCIVFTDAYPDSDDEACSELLDGARAIGAVCLREDLLRVISRRGKGSTKEYILIDENELTNIKTFAALAADGLCERLDGTVIRIFYDNDSFSLTEQQIIRRIRERYGRRFHGDEAKINAHAPAVDRIRGTQNMIYRLLTEYPLYEPLLASDGAPDSRTLNVGIAGTGGIGTEMLLAASWCGQMPGITLGINAVSLESEVEFCGSLDRINPELRQSAAAGSSLLSVYPEDGLPQVLNDPYMVLRYGQADVTAGDIAALTCTQLPAPDGIPASEKSTLRLIDCDYLLVSLGSDEKNIETAERLKRAAAADRIRSGSRRHLFIACVVYDADLADTLNSSAGDSGGMIRMRAIGSLRDIYSSDNIFLKSTERTAQILNRRYEAQQTDDVVGEMLRRAANVYNYMSSTARAIHIKYKIYASLRCIPQKGEADALRRLLTDFTQCRTAQTLSTPASAALRQELTDRFFALLQPDTGVPQLSALLSWNEHRRWNAYMRSVGFMHRSDRKPKDIALRLHPTLVESKNPLTEQTDRSDLLDEISGIMQTVYKDFDNPLRDFK